MPKAPDHWIVIIVVDSMVLVNLVYHIVIVNPMVLIVLNHYY
ncbi:hypothetical protein DERF_000113 [Dermatophagoides farinae]|uniref:Uncharacterized protein n=1 Tax=Dermatophagoides farinae TaxID=6954 RepID=A0A922IC52_DERFA|nr:hypothetical protein DERF_000113 [Dermatophagoides farinae]